jgi:hypothetical protein
MTPLLDHAEIFGTELPVIGEKFEYPYLDAHVTLGDSRSNGSLYRSFSNTCAYISSILPLSRDYGT